MTRSRAHTRTCGLAGVFLSTATITIVFAFGIASQAAAEEAFHRLTPAQIKARLAGMEITDDVHWAEQYMRDGTFKSFYMGKASNGKWSVRDKELCLDDDKSGLECKEVWLSGNKVEFHVQGSSLPALQGVLQKQQPRR